MKNNYVIPTAVSLKQAAHIGYDPTPKQFEVLRVAELTRGLNKEQTQVVHKILEGHSFNSIAKTTQMSSNKVYAIKKQLKKKYQFLYDEKKRGEYVQANSKELDLLLAGVAMASRELSLSQFQQIYVDDYDPEAQQKDWGQVALQDVYYQIWESNQKTVTEAPREHLKTTSAISYIAKKIFERTFPLEIDYFHLNRDIAIEKIRKLQNIVERNPILGSRFQIDQAKNWKDGEIRLLDGTTIKATGWLSGSVGKHPHIIVLDDVIDQSVVYSEDKNAKSVRKFYSDIYPMITKLTEEKKIIIIGTAQREDDLYSSLPEDFVKNTFRAFIDPEETKPLEPALFSAEELHKIKRDMSEKHGEKFWLKEYMNTPFSAMGMIIKPEWIKTYTSAPDKLDIYQGWDLSVGKKIEEGDWTAGATIGTRTHNSLLEVYILDIFKARIPFAERLNVITSSANRWKPKKIAIEQNTFQYDTVQTLKKQTNLPIIGVSSINNKIERFQTELAPHFESGKVYIASDMDDLRKELLSLPAGKYDDQADAVTIAIKASAFTTRTPNIRVL